MVLLDYVNSTRNPQEKTIPLENTQNALPKRRRSLPQQICNYYLCLLKKKMSGTTGHVASPHICCKVNKRKKEYVGVCRKEKERENVIQ